MIKWKYQEIEYIKRNKREFLNLKNSIPGMKKSLGRFKGKFEQTKKSMNLKMKQQK